MKKKHFRSGVVALVAILLSAAGTAASAQTASKTKAQPARPDQPAQVFKAWDKDGNGSLSLVEFRSGWQQVQRNGAAQARLRQQFGRVDGNDDNAIDANEYAQLVLIKRAGKQAPPLARFDANANGKLEFDEYLKLVQAMAPRPAAKGSTK